MRVLAMSTGYFSDSHYANHRRAEQHRVKQYGTRGQTRPLSQDQAAEYCAEAVTKSKVRHTAEPSTASEKSFYYQLPVTVPAVKATTMITVTMPLHIA
jgi:hypothetical protein